jgi:hypothetical protein
MSLASLLGWDRLRHGGLLLDAPRLQVVGRLEPPALSRHHEEELRRQASALLAGNTDASVFVAFVLERVCGFSPGDGTWLRGSAVGSEWNRRTPMGETAKPRHLWLGPHGASLPVFLDTEKQIGLGRGRRTASQVVQWLRAGPEKLALLTNGRQWRLIFAGLDFDAWCEWDVDLWFEEGALSPQVHALRTLLSLRVFTPPTDGQPAPLLAAILDSRKGQAELSAALGERVREAVELLVQAHGEALAERCNLDDAAETYRAAVRVVMRLVVVLFAESRDLLPRDNALYHGAYGVGGLLEELEKTAARGGNRLARSYSAWPRLLALFRLVHLGSHHPALPVPAYGGELFAPAMPEATDGLSRALHVFESAAFDTSRAIVSDHDVHRLLEKISRTRVRLRQGRQHTWVTVPVDFSDLSSEYIGILYEGLLDFELRTAKGDPVIFLAVGNQPALPLTRLEGMDDKTLAALLEKMKDTSKKGDDEGEGSEEAEEAEEEADGDEDEGVADGVDADAADSTVSEDTDADGGDQRHTTRTRAEVWARRAVEAGKLVVKPRGTLTPEKRRAYDEAVARKARQLVVRVVLPGEWFLVRWGGTRKGSGTFYTRPGLAVPTVQRTLRPLAYTPPEKPDGTPDTDAPAQEWTPRLPEEILSIRVCDPSCGSGTFPITALRYLTDAVFEAVHRHGRVTSDQGDRSVVALLGDCNGRRNEVAQLRRELIPCRPDDASFEPRLKALLKRYVVERCIYGVDFNPLAVELCRLSLWIETMDRTLPFSFLDHKVKCGNSLVGAWFDQFLHYPAMAWKNREGGDKSHSNGVHFQRGVRGNAYNAFLTERVTPDLRRLLEGRTLFSEDLLGRATAVHDDALDALSRLHDLPVHDSAERSRLYREELAGSAAHQSLKAALDLWCACWFWPADELEDAPLPTTLANPTQATRAVAARIAIDYRFFHWELEFPDVFRESGSGFDAVLGNPPWDIAKTNSKEFFSDLDPLYRGLGNPEARQRQIFADATVERAWLDYCERFVAWSNFVKYTSNPFGDPEQAAMAGDSFSIVRGGGNTALHAEWRAVRSRAQGFSDPAHPFRSQGASDLNLYKLFAEQMVRLLRPGGNVGVVLPASIYNDSGAGPLRRLLLTQCDLQWLFSFENRAKIFPIDSRFRFCCMIARRGSPTKSVRVAFGRRDLSDWVEAERIVIEVAGEDLHMFSPISSSIPEVESAQDLDVLRTLFANGTVLGGQKAAAWGVKYNSNTADYHMTKGRLAGRFLPADTALAGATSVAPGHWKFGDKTFVALYTGKMVAPFDFAYQRWVSGSGVRATWESLDFSAKDWCPEFVAPVEGIRHRWQGGTRLVFRDITNATNERTMLAAVIPAWPCGNKVPLLAEEGQMSVARQLALGCLLNSFAYDFVVRNRITGVNLNKFIVDETPVPELDSVPLELSVIGARLSMVHEVFAGAWLELLHACPALGDRPWKEHWVVDPLDRVELRAISEAIVAHLFGLTEPQFRWILRNCDHPKDRLAELSFRTQLPAKGFWRTGIGSAEHPWRQAWACGPEVRLTNLAIVAFIELARLKASSDGDLATSVRAFAPASGRGGWKLPERLRLRDYGLGQDERADEAQTLRPAQPCEDARRDCDTQNSWRECQQVAEHLRTLWGGTRNELPDPPSVAARPALRNVRSSVAGQGALFGSDE